MPARPSLERSEISWTAASDKTEIPGSGGAASLTEVIVTGESSSNYVGQESVVPSSSTRIAIW